MRHRVLAAACAVWLAGGCVAWLIGGAAPARAAQVRTDVLLVALPEAEARAFLAARPASLGVGVFPDSRSAEAFADELTTGAPSRRGSPVTGVPGRVAELLRRARVEVVVVPPSAGVGSARALVDVFLRPAPGAPFVSSRRVVVMALATAADAERQSEGSVHTVVLGMGDHTPVVVGILGARGVLVGGISGRDGIVTPYDVSATLLAWLDVRATGVIGSSLRARPSPSPLAEVDALSARARRDAGFAPWLSAVVGTVGVIAAAAALLARRLGRSNLAEMLARAAAMVPAGYLAGLFVPSASWEPRALPLVAAVAFGLSWRRGDAARFCGRALAWTAVAVMALAVAAAFRPGGEPALSLWGDPLTSWRFFGLRNHLAAFVAGGVVAGAALSGWSRGAALAAAVAGAVVVGAPQLGANFVGVLTLVFGATVSLVARGAGRVRARHLVLGGVFGIFATALALLADARSPVSHGGRAVRTIRDDGARALWQFVSERARLDYREVASGGVFGFLGFAGVAIVMVALFVWASRARDSSFAIPAAVAGASAAAFAALFVEDSGFFTGAILGLYPAVAFAAGSATAGSATARFGSRATPGGA